MQSSGRSQRGADGDQWHHIPKKSFELQANWEKISSRIRRPVPDFGYESMGLSTYCAKKKTFSDKKGFRASSSELSNIGRSMARSFNGLLLYALIVLNMVFNIFANGLN